MKDKTKIPYYLKWWFFLPLSFLVAIIGGGYLFSFFFPNSTDYNVATLMLLIWAGVVISWMSYKKKYKNEKM